MYSRKLQFYLNSVPFKKMHWNIFSRKRFKLTVSNKCCRVLRGTSKDHLDSKVGVHLVVISRSTCVFKCEAYFFVSVMKSGTFYVQIGSLLWGQHYPWGHRGYCNVNLVVIKKTDFNTRNERSKRFYLCWMSSYVMWSIYPLEVRGNFKVNLFSIKNPLLQSQKWKEQTIFGLDM